jgi:hypothetical protein
MPLATKTASSREMPGRPDPAQAGQQRLGGACTGCPAPTRLKVTSAATSSTGGNTQASRRMPSPRSLASIAGKAAAMTTPSSPKPSRAAVSRVRSAEVSPTSAPQA